MIRRAQQRRAQPGRQILVTVSALLFLVVLSYWKHSGTEAQGLHGRLSRRSQEPLLDENEKCRHVHRKLDQCAWIKHHCPDEEAGLISYLSLYYCRLPHLKPLAFILIVSWTALLFATIGIAASDFFCVNLSTISSVLGMSESMAGVTLLAFGNGSPDVFSTFAAVRTNSGSLAMGELIGAAGFITAVVSGSMALVRPFKVAKRSFVRDIGFFIVAVAFSMVFVANGKLEMWESAAMVGFYAFYVIVVVIWHWWLDQRRRRREMYAVARGEYIDPAGDEIASPGGYYDEDEGDTGTPYSRHASMDDFRDLEMADSDEPELDELDEEVDRDKWMGELTSGMRVTRTPAGERRNIYTPIRPSLIGALEFQSTLHSLRKSRNIQSIPINLRRYSDDPNFTQLQTQQYAQSVASDPERLSLYNESLREHDDSDSGDTTNDHGRARAKSANAADLLSPRPNRWQKLRRAAMGSPIDGASDHSNNEAAEPFPGGAGAERTSAPLIKIEPPELSLTPPAIVLNDNGTAEQQDEGRSRSSTTDLLLPPDQQRTRSRSASQSSQASQTRRSSGNSTPRLSLQTSLRGSRSHSLVRSPLIYPRFDGTHSPFGIAQRCMSPEPLSRIQSQEDLVEAKPLAWWPYKVFVPPEVIVRTLFPTLQNWREKNLGGKVVGILSLPSFFLLTITLPVVEPQATEPEPTFVLPVNGSTMPSSHTPNATAPTAIHENHEPTNGITSITNQQFQSNQNDQASKRNSVQTPVIVTTSSEQNESTNKAPDQPPNPVGPSRDWNRWLVTIQCYSAPIFIVLIVHANLDSTLTNGPRALLHATLYTLLASTITLIIILFTTTSTRPPRWHFLLTFAGFAVAVAWISSIANEVVGVLKAIGIIFNITDAILGLTIFAVGNSLGDLVADITVAKLGYPVMALSACFGGPMLNILLGVGLSGLYMTIRGANKHKKRHPEKPWKARPYHVDVSVSLVVSAGVLLLTLIGLVVVVPLNGWRMDRRVGWGLIALWVVATLANVGVELSGLGDIEA